MNRHGNTHSRAPRHLPADVLLWRSNVLLQAGCETSLAWELAADGGVDLHDFLNLLDRGCPPDLAARILAPLDRAEPPPAP